MTRYSWELLTVLTWAMAYYANGGSSPAAMAIPTLRYREALQEANYLSTATCVNACSYALYNTRHPALKHPHHSIKRSSVH